MPRSYSASEIASEAGCPEDRVRWLSDIGLLTPDTGGRFSFGDVLTSKMVSALLESGLPAATIGRPGPYPAETLVRGAACGSFVDLG